MNSIPEHWTEYSNLCDLLKTYRVYEMVYEDFYVVHSVVEYFANSTIVSSNTLIAAKKFQDSWYSFINKENYSSDCVFIYLNSEFQSILDNELREFLKSLNNDLQKVNFKNIESIEVEIREFPDKEAILERGSTLYGLLIKHGIVKKFS